MNTCGKISIFENLALLDRVYLNWLSTILEFLFEQHAIHLSKISSLVSRVHRLRINFRYLSAVEAFFFPLFFLL